MSSTSLFISLSGSAFFSLKHMKTSFKMLLKIQLKEFITCTLVKQEQLEQGIIYL